MQVPFIEVNSPVDNTPRNFSPRGGGMLYVKNTGTEDVYIAALEDPADFDTAYAWKLEPGESVPVPDSQYGKSGNVLYVATASSGITSTIAFTGSN